MIELEANGKEQGHEAQSLSPFKDALVKKYQKKLDFLKTKAPHISFSFANQKLNQDMAGVFANLDFTIHTTNSQEPDNLLKRIPFWLYNNNIVLLHYRPESGDSSLVNLLRGIKSTIRKVSFKNFIPVFFVAYSSKKQIEVCRRLGAFGIRHVIFVSPGVPIETNEEELLKGLVDFGELLKRTEGKLEIVPQKEKEEKVASDEEIEKLRHYQDLMREANTCMEDEEYEKAITFYTKAIKLKPDCEVLLRRGDSYFRIKDYPHALGDYSNAAKLDQSLPEPFAKISACCFILVKKYKEKGEEEQAKKKLTLGMDCVKKAKQKVAELIDKNKVSPENVQENPYAIIISTLIDCDMRNLGYEDVEKEIEKLTTEVLTAASANDHMDASMNMDERIDYALLMARNKQYEKAEIILRSIIKEDVHTVAPVFNNFAVELRKNEQYGKAFEIYSELFHYDIPDRGIVIENHRTAGLRYGGDLRINFKMKEAITVYKKILSCGPKYQEWVLCELAMTYLELQDKPQASLRLMEALYINPSLMRAKRFEHYQDLKNLKHEMISILTEYNEDYFDKTPTEVIDDDEEYV